MIGIIGNGVVGSTLASWFSSAKVYDLDPSRSPNTLREVLDCETVFLAVNIVDNAATEVGFGVLNNYLDKMQSGTRVVVKTTIVPGTCDQLQANHPLLRVMYNPEFLTEATPVRDFEAPHIQVVGVQEVARGYAAAQGLLDILPYTSQQYIVTLRQAELLKHSVAAFLSTKVSWFNQLYSALGDEDFEAVRAMISDDPRIGPSHTNVTQNGYRGWAGKCFTKDTPAFAKWSAMPIMEHVVRYNRDLLAKQGLDEWARTKETV